MLAEHVTHIFEFVQMQRLEKHAKSLVRWGFFFVLLAIVLFVLQLWYLNWDITAVWWEQFLGSGFALSYAGFYFWNARKIFRSNFFRR